MPTEVQVFVRSAADIVIARQEGRALAMKLGFAGADLTLIATGISEVARNILDHAKHGDIVVKFAEQADKRGILIVAKDQGPGIPDVNQAMQYGYSTRKGLGVGLPGTKWLMDEFDIHSELGKGTMVVMKKWLR